MGLRPSAPRKLLRSLVSSKIPTSNTNPEDRVAWFPLGYATYGNPVTPMSDSKFQLVASDWSCYFFPSVFVHRFSLAGFQEAARVVPRCRLKLPSSVSTVKHSSMQNPEFFLVPVDKL